MPKPGASVYRGGGGEGLDFVSYRQQAMFYPSRVRDFLRAGQKLLQWGIHRSNKAKQNKTPALKQPLTTSGKDRFSSHSRTARTAIRSR